jgi:type III restriction enzyme
VPPLATRSGNQQWWLPRKLKYSAGPWKRRILHLCYRNPKQARLRARGIKVLSLFFIDRVDNYAAEDGIIRRLFEQAFEDKRASFPEWAGLEAEAVQGYYFASRRTRDGTEHLKDSKTGEAKQDQEVYDLILRDKERLLSFEEPISFIFSHSALREGWDNPNVFQICTLNQSVSETRKRQEVGRGVRLAVNQEGARVHDDAVNRLTVVANESYERFVAQYQHEIASEYQEEIEARYGKPLDALDDEERLDVEAEYGAGILPPPPADARQRAHVTLRKEYVLKPEFKELWERIRRKTRYAVRVDSEKLIDDVVTALAVVDIDPPRVAVTKVALEPSPENAFEAIQLSGAKTALDLAGRYPLPNLVDILANLMEHTTPSVRLTRQTLLEILRRAPHPRELVENPYEFALAAVRLIKDRVAGQLIDGIQYVPIGEGYEASQLDVDIETWLNHVEPAEKSIYTYVIYDSEIERQFARDLEAMDQVRLYIKLPAWFTVPTPIGEYNPDWAIVKEERDAHGEPIGEKLFLVCETKGTPHREELRISEQRKIYCAERHSESALDVPYQVVTNAKDLL